MGFLWEPLLRRSQSVGCCLASGWLRWLCFPGHDSPWKAVPPADLPPWCEALVQVGVGSKWQIGSLGCRGIWW